MRRRPGPARCVPAGPSPKGSRTGGEGTRASPGRARRRARPRARRRARRPSSPWPRHAGTVWASRPTHSARRGGDDHIPSRPTRAAPVPRVNDDNGTEVRCAVDEVARPSSSTNRNRPAARPGPGRAEHAVQSHGHRSRSARPPATPVSRGHMMLRTSSWLREGSRPVRTTRHHLGWQGARRERAAAELQVGPPREVDAARRRGRRPGRRSSAAGRREVAAGETQAHSAPSSAGQGRSTPGHRSRRSRERPVARDTDGPSRSGTRARGPRVTSRLLPQGPAGLRTRDHPVRDAFPDLAVQWLSCRAPPVTLTAARQSRIRTGFPAPPRRTTGG